LALAPVLWLLACSGGKVELNPVQGKVLDKNGQPAKGALVTFRLQGANEMTTEPSTGLVGEDGTFTLTTGSKEGAPAGEYIVTIIWPEEGKPKSKFSTEQPDSRDRLQGAYANPANGFKVEIKKGPNQVAPFPLK
jgi:hypothetical protein